MRAALATYSRMLTRLPPFLRRRMSLLDARAEIARRLQARAETFLALVAELIHPYPTSPYARLLAHAGCTPGDLEQAVRRDGLAAALRGLREQGVYVTFDELKGRRPVRRGSLSFVVTAEDFNNPALSRLFSLGSGGSTGVPTRVDIDLEHMLERAPHLMLLQEAHGIRDAPIALWNGTGTLHLLRGALYGYCPERWFAAVDQRDGRSRASWLDTWALVITGRLFGHRWPWPEPTPPAEAARVAEWAVAALRRAGRASLSTMISNAVRMCAAAVERGHDLSGLRIFGAGEPATEAKLAAVRASGARFVSSYIMAEAGHVGSACAAPADGTDVHLMEDAIHLEPVRQSLPGAGLEVDQFCLTGLLPRGPKVLLNAFVDDFGTVETRACGCLYDGLGLRTHLRQIFSASKLTGEGMNLAGTGVVRLLEEELPRRFGGSPIDWQLREEEDERALTRLAIVVSPRVPLADEGAVVAAFLEGVARDGAASDQVARVTWRHTGAVRVVREEPLLTPAGKLLPLRVAQRVRGRV